jgi:hypothetical protein
VIGSLNEYKNSVADHVPFEEIEMRYRKAKDGHWQAIWLIAQGTPAQHVAEMTSYSYTWVRTLVQSYNHDGPDALSDGCMAMLVVNASCLCNSSSSYKKPWSTIHPMENCGQAPRWPSGLPNRPKGLDIPEMGSLGYNPDAEPYIPDTIPVLASSAEG